MAWSEYIGPLTAEEVVRFVENSKNYGPLWGWNKPRYSVSLHMEQGDVRFLIVVPKYVWRRYTKGMLDQLAVDDLLTEPERDENDGV